MKPDPILEECYRIKEEYNSQFKDVQALIEHLKEVEAEEKRKGRKYAPPLQHLEFSVPGWQQHGCLFLNWSFRTRVLSGGFFVSFC